MAKKGATSINIKVVATAGSGGGGKVQQHNLRAIGLGREQIQVEVKLGEVVKKQMESHHVLEDLMKKHFGGKDMEKLSPEERKEVNKKFTDEVGAEMEKRGLYGKYNDPEDKIVMSHVDPKRTSMNDFLIIHPLEDYLESTLKPLVKELTGQKMKDICTPFKEGVVVIKPETTIEDIMDFGRKVEKELGWHPVQVYIHHDEGHTDEHSQEWMENHHAHIVFDTIDHGTGKTIQLNRLDLANMQTMLAETLKMERGENSSDLAHLNTLEFKAQMEQANMRLNLSLSVQNVGQDPRQLMVDVINRTIKETMECKGEYKPNDRPTLNLLREVGKDLNTNPTARCADAIFDELQRQPEKAVEIAKILGASTKDGKNAKDDNELMEGIRTKLYDTATFCGKTESAKMFRPLLNSAKELNLDLTPVMLEPIRKAIPFIMSQPIDRDNNNMLWCATARCKTDPMQMLQQAQDKGIADLKDTIADQEQMLEKVIDRVASARQEHVEVANQLLDAQRQTTELSNKKTIIEGSIAELNEDRRKLQDKLSEIKSEIDVLNAPEVEESWKDKLSNIFNADPDKVTKKEMIEAYPILKQQVETLEKENRRLDVDNFMYDRKAIANADIVRENERLEAQVKSISENVAKITGQKQSLFDPFSDVKKGLELIISRFEEDDREKEILKKKNDTLSKEIDSIKGLFNPILHNIFDKLRDMGAKTAQIIRMFAGRKGEDGSAIHDVNLDKGQRLMAKGETYTCNGKEVMALKFEGGHPNTFINGMDAELFVSRKGVPFKDFREQSKDNSQDQGRGQKM